MTSETFQQPLLQVAQLSVSFPSPQGLIEAVNALSFDVHAGEVLALVGESGSGKSVTARTLVGLAGARGGCSRRVPDIAWARWPVAEFTGVRCPPLAATTRARNWFCFAGCTDLA